MGAISKHRTAIYAGSFDPLTKGHIWVIEQGLSLFDHLYIAIGINPAKKPFFDTSDRVSMIDEYLSRTGFDKFADVILFDNEFLVDVAQDIECPTILRGIRNSQDFAYELEIKNFNDELNPRINTVFVSPPPRLAGVSSSIIRGVAGLKNWESALSDKTTDYVITKLKERLAISS